MATHDQYVDLLAENERLRDELTRATIKLRVYAYWVGRIHRGERDAVSLAECCRRDIAHTDELDPRDTAPMPRHPSAYPLESMFPRCLP